MVASLNVSVPLLSMAPPTVAAVLLERVLLVIVTVPPLLLMPPPLPDPTMLPAIVVLFSVSVPESFSIAPPAVVALLLDRVSLVRVTVPALFPRTPPWMA